MMASTNGGAYGRDVTSGEGLEVDLSAAGLHELPESLGIEATPRELLSRPGTRIRRNPEKELAHDSDLKIPFGSRSSLKSKGVLLLLVATIIIIVIVLAVAVPLALRLRKPSKPYVRDLYSRGHT